MQRRTLLATLVLAALVAPGLAQAQDGGLQAQGSVQQVQPGPGLTVLLWHPYPDKADPLGFPFEDGRDGYWARHAHFDAEEDGFDFPHMVADGVTAVEGLPDPDAPYASTRGAYESAVDDRAAADPPVALELSAQPAADGEGDAVEATAAILPRTALDGESLHLWVALVEDHVHYAPPPRVSNGVTDHRFTVRAAEDLGVVDLSRGAPVVHNATFTAPDDAPAEQLYVAAWLQQGPSHGLRFDPYEVVQSTIHRVEDPGVTRQDDKGVLMELYSATWCDPCLFGDRAAEELAAERGLETVDPTPVRASYLRAPASWIVFGLAAAVGAAAFGLTRLPRGRP